MGGTPVQNVGAYGQEVAPVIERVRAFDLEERKLRRVQRGRVRVFAIAAAASTTTDRGRFIVTRVDFRLTPAARRPCAIAELRRAVEAAHPEAPNPRSRRWLRCVRRIRQSKGMLLVEGDPDCRSAGSFFKNPVVSKELLEDCAPRAGSAATFSRGVRTKAACKIPAAWLIEQAGFGKGYTLGNAGISSRHTLALVNRSGATAREILALAEKISAAVEARFGIRLEREPVLLGSPFRA